MSLTSLSGGAAGLMIKKAGATAYATLSSADADTKDSPNKPTLSNSDLTATASSTGEWNLGGSTLGFTTGKWYWEVVPTGNGMLGVEPTSEDIDRQYFNSGTSGLASRDGKIWFGGTLVVTGQTDWTDGQTIGVAFNADEGYIYFYINGTLSYSYDSTMSNSVFKKPAYAVYTTGGGDAWTFTFNFGESSFAQTPPTGYKAVSTDNGASES